MTIPATKVLAVCVALSIAAIAITWLHIAVSAEEAVPPASRDAVWRSIFARDETLPDKVRNATSHEKIALGHDLFRDPRLSGDGQRACSSCHEPGRAFTNGLATAKGLGGEDLRRNVPHLYNLAWSTNYFWDGRAASLEEQARQPITAADEMAADFPAITVRLGADPAMSARFAAAFSDAPVISEANILAALAAYERSLVSPQTRFDLWVAGDEGALSAHELQGFRLFVGKAGCVACHGGWRLTDDAFHDIGLSGDDPGRGAVAGGVPGLAAFKTPGLRELRHTAPYMHDGSLVTLRAVVDHYAGHLDKRASLDPNVVRDLVLDEKEKSALVAFLESLSGE